MIWQKYAQSAKDREKGVEINRGMGKFAKGTMPKQSAGMSKK